MNKLNRLKSYANILNCSAYTLRNLNLNQEEEKKVLNLCYIVRDYQSHSLDYQEKHLRNLRDRYYKLTFIPEDILDILWKQYTQIFFDIEQINYVYREGGKLESINF